MQMLDDAAATAARLPYARLIPAVAQAMLDLRAGHIHSCPRAVLPLPEGGSYLAMPCTDAQYAISKLVSVTPANQALGLPTIQGLVLASDARNGSPLALLHGGTVTARRTAAVSLLGIQRLLGRVPQDLTLVGTGGQAWSHALALLEVWPGLRLRIKGRAGAAGFVQRLAASGLAATVWHEGDDYGDCVLAATTSLKAVLPDEVASETLIVGIGSFRPDMAELPATQVRARQVFVDDPEGARHEAGDLLQAGVDWSRVHGLAELLAGEVRVEGPLLYKTVGQAAWDMAAVRCALG
ncbi:delta(1)-pyrroline-2-carboxylate reductase family protein [Paucibacter soli]|uniref:delta(1)-pyrroline-2-carboxylate reductase family protein n=1 Tax=Paucibacter soli TaxID=3133433 RepID=UPI0030B1D868